MSEQKAADPKEVISIYGSMDELLASGVQNEEFATIDGFEPGKKIRIGSVTAGDIMQWSEASEGEAKKTAGLRLIIKSLVGPPPSNLRYANDAKNIDKFRAFRHKETERIVREILKLNGMTVKEQAEAKKD